MPIISIMRVIFSLLLFFSVFGIFAAPLERGYPLAPGANASQAERDRAFINLRLRVIEASRVYLGTPYRYGGMSNTGVDCSGFVGLSFYDVLGVSLPRSASAMYTWSERIPIERAQPGDLLFFRTSNSNNITHVGLFLGNRTFIHAASDGPRTGVIYSTMDETYWANCYAGAGRAFPETTPFTVDGGAAVSGNSSQPNRSGGTQTASSRSQNGNNRVLLGLAFAPSWSGVLNTDNVIRGYASQICLSSEITIAGKKNVFGLEVRPEYDGALGVFRLPITISWGMGDNFRIFAGPVLSYGDAVLYTEDGDRRYNGGTSWLGAIGVTVLPFIAKTPAGEFAPYIEAAWQSYFIENQKFNLLYDFSAGFRLSTGLRWQIKVH
ncbi:MAG: C40 family peptidase [Treponema sp.]|nr:C40 family peptidase [Treponema sp.]MCL2237471.1 C40 family peptidase [Treponema sp.]